MRWYNAGPYRRACKGEGSSMSRRPRSESWQFWVWKVHDVLWSANATSITRQSAQNQHDLGPSIATISLHQRIVSSSTECEYDFAVRESKLVTINIQLILVDFFMFSGQMNGRNLRNFCALRAGGGNCLTSRTEFGVTNNHVIRQGIKSAFIKRKPIDSLRWSLE